MNPNTEDGAAGGSYAFGDSPTAGRRLELLGQVFQPTTHALLLGLSHDDPRIVLDLGCGPGHTTRLLSARFPEATVVGLDNSPAFIARAARAMPGRARFTCHDVTQAPFPDAPADVIFARHLLAHLREPAELIGQWTSQLAPGGLLVLEETEWIKTADHDFTRYLDLVTELLHARGTQLYVGQLLTSLAAPRGLSAAHRGVAMLEVTTGHASTMFSLNLATIRNDELVEARHPAHELDALAEALTRRTHDEQRGVITWGVSQIVLRAGP